MVADTPSTLEKPAPIHPPTFGREASAFWQPAARLAQLDADGRIDPVVTVPGKSRKRSTIEFLARVAPIGLFSACFIRWLQAAVDGAPSWVWIPFALCLILAGVCLWRMLEYVQRIGT